MPVPDVPGIKNSTHRRTGLQRVFVYGTLKMGMPNHINFLHEARPLGQAHISGIMFHIGGFPAINLSEQFCSIVGEVYEVTWDTILDLDRLEGVERNFYDRVEARVEPHGIVWMYIFPRTRAQACDYVVPSGNWQGPTTPKVKWGGFGKGIEVGIFETDPAKNEIAVGNGTSEYVLRRSLVDNTYKLTHKVSGEIIGSFQHLRDKVLEDGTRKPVLRLPAASRPTIDGSVKERLRTDGSVVNSEYNPPPRETPPIIWTPDMITKEEKAESIPQAARLLGVKYGAA